MCHAVNNAIRIHFGDGYQMIVDPSTTGKLLEIGINSHAEIFHAMTARPEFLR